MDNEKIWIENPRILITNYKNFIPKKQSSKVSQINALTQLLLYVFIVTLILFTGLLFMYLC